MHKWDFQLFKPIFYAMSLLCNLLYWLQSLDEGFVGRTDVLLLKATKKAYPLSQYTQSMKMLICLILIATL